MDWIPEGLRRFRWRRGVDAPGPVSSRRSTVPGMWLDNPANQEYVDMLRNRIARDDGRAILFLVGDAAASRGVEPTKRPITTTAAKTLVENRLQGWCVALAACLRKHWPRHRGSIRRSSPTWSGATGYRACPSCCGWQQAWVFHRVTWLMAWMSS